MPCLQHFRKERSMVRNNKNGDGGKTNFFVTLVRSSIILSALDRFSTYIYTLIKNGLFGYIFSGYRHDMPSLFAEKFRKSKTSSHFAEFRYGMCRRIEASYVVYYTQWLMKFLLGCKLKVYGSFLASFGIYTAVVTSIVAILENNIGSLVSHTYIAAALVMIISSVALILSKKTLSEALVSSAVGYLIRKITGFTEEDIGRTVGDGGHTNTAFLLGLICGALSYSISPIYILAGIAAVVWAYLVLIRPELGVLTLFVTMPIFPTMLLAAIVIYTTLCWFIKLFRGKRVLRIEPVDIMVMAFLVLMFFGGAVSLSGDSLKPALLMVCLALGYFLTVELITTREWLVRCSVACVISASIVSLYGIIMYFFGDNSAGSWLDTEMFSTISGRATATLENPNMLGEYLILIIPTAVAMFIGRGEGLRRLSSFICIGIMGVCLILTWSRGAWLGLIFAALLFLFMWHRRSVWLIFAGIAAIPILPSILPESIVSRFMSIGDLADSSTSYRVYIWRAAVNMIGDNFITGIGIGESAWNRLYPLYSYQGVESAPHSHNLFLQIWIELGIFGIVIFVAFLFMLYQSGFTFFSKLSDNSELKTPDISESILRRNLNSEEKTDIRTEMQRGKTQLRITSAGPLCGILAVLVQGMTDYAWYNYRLYLMFWLMCGLASAYIRGGRKLLGSVTDDCESEPTSCVKEISVSSHEEKTVKNRNRKSVGETDDE